MEIGFGIVRDESVDITLFISVEKLLQSYFSTKHYGDDVKKIVIGIVCVPEERANFITKKKPKFTLYKEVKVVNKTLVFDRVFEYEIWLKFSLFQSYTLEAEKRGYLASEILESLVNLNAIPKSVKYFDKDLFQSDLEYILKELMSNQAN
jgi:hypothetical protein